MYTSVALVLCSTSATFESLPGFWCRRSGIEPPAPLPPTSRSPARVSTVMHLIPVPLQLLFLVLCTLALSGSFSGQEQSALNADPIASYIHKSFPLQVKSLNLNIGLGLNWNILDFYSTWIFCDLEKLTNTHKHCSLVFSQTQVNMHTHTSSKAYLLQYCWHVRRLKKNMSDSNW